MKLIYVFISLVFTSRCLSDRIIINEVLLIENNYLGENGTKIKTDEGYLKSMSVKFINDGKEFFDDSCQLNKRYHDDMKKRSYSVLSPVITKYILSTLDSSKNGILKFHYIFTNSKCRFKKVFKTFHSKERCFDSFKVLNKGKRDTIGFEDDGIEAYLSHIKLILTEIIKSKLLIIEDIDSMEQILEFKFKYFKTHSSCLSNLKNFINFLNFRTLEDDNEILFLQKGSAKNTTNKFKTSFFQKNLQYKFVNEYAKKETDDARILNSYEQIKHFCKECCAELTEYLLSNKIILPFKGTFTLDYYLDKFYSFIKKVIEEMIEDINKDCVNSVKKFYDYQQNFLNQVTNMFKEIIDSAWEFLNVIEYFSNFFDREIKTVEDFVEIDRLLCDYHNMLICGQMIKNNDDYSKLVFLNPMLIDDYPCRLLRAIELTLKNPNRFKEIKIYNFTGEKLHIRKNVDFYVNLFENDSIMITFEKIRERNIRVIEIISENEEICETIYVGKFLDNYYRVKTT